MCKVPKKPMHYKYTKPTGFPVGSVISGHCLSITVITARAGDLVERVMPYQSLIDTYKTFLESVYTQKPLEFRTSVAL